MGIYKIINLLTNKIYIGKSLNIFKRWQTHIIELSKGKHPAKNFQYDYIELNMNPTNLRFEIVEIVEDTTELSNREEYWITYFDSTNPSIGYNTLGNKDNKSFNDILAGTNKDIINDIKIHSLIKENLRIIGIDSFQCGNANNKTYKKYLSLKNSFSKKWFNSLSEDEIYYIGVLFNNFLKSKTSFELRDSYWTCFYNVKDDLIKTKEQVTEKRFVPLSGKNLSNKKQCILYFANLYVNAFEYNDYEIIDNDKFALIMILNWIVNVADINKQIDLFLPSKRMKLILENYINNK